MIKGNPNQLNNHQANLINKSSITPDQILNNLDGLNEEIQESYDQELATELAEKDGIGVSIEEEEEEEQMEEVEDQLAKEAEEAERILEEQRQAALEKAQEESKKQEEEVSPEEQQKNAVLEFFKSTKGAPSEKQIAALKQKYGKNGIHVLALGEDDVYIFTYLRRGQWQQIQKVVAAAQNSDVNQNAEELLKEKVIQYTVKWPKGVSSPEFLYNSRAGVIDTLYQTILLNSYFLSPQQAMMLTTQL